jgi:hypothetical protein
MEGKQALIMNRKVKHHSYALGLQTHNKNSDETITELCVYSIISITLK